MINKVANIGQEAWNCKDNTVKVDIGSKMTVLLECDLSA